MRLRDLPKGEAPERDPAAEAAAMERRGKVIEGGTDKPARPPLTADEVTARRNGPPGSTRR
jgi:hypothetical protein